MSGSSEQMLRLITGMWGRERVIECAIPAGWRTVECGPAPEREMTGQEIAGAIRRGFDADTTFTALEGKKIVIVTDDLWRPTPAARILEPLLDELRGRRAADKDITVILACGTHQAPAPDEIRRKVGARVTASLRVSAHDCRANIADLGKTPAGTPVTVNRAVVEAEVRIVVGGIYPHLQAGFSGGAKNLVPGVCGFETIDYLHERLQGAQARGGSTQTPLRREMAAAAGKIGPYLLINAALNCRGEIAALFAGAPEQAFADAESYARSHYRVSTHSKADIVLVEAFPFDMSYNLLADRSLWPLTYHADARKIIVLGDCAQGMGSHELDYSAGSRLKRRLRSAARGELHGLSRGLMNMLHAGFSAKKKPPFVLVSSVLRQVSLTGLKHVGTAATLDEALGSQFQQRSGGTMAIYRAAGLCYA